MKLFDRFIRAIERNSRENERVKLVAELDALDADRDHAVKRIPQIIARLDLLANADIAEYLNRHEPVKSVSQMVEDDATLPEGAWKARA